MKIKKILKKIAKAFGVLLLVIIVMTVALYFWNTRTVEIHDEDLIYHFEKVDDSENAYIVLLPALKQLKEHLLIIKSDDFGKVLREVPFDYEKANSLLMKYPFQPIFSEAMKLGTFQYPEGFDRTKMAEFEWYGVELISLARLEQMYIKKLIHENKMEQVLDESLKLLKFSCLLRNANVEIITFLIAIIIRNIAIAEMQELITTSDFNNNFYKTYLERIEICNDKNALVNALRFEYTVDKNYFKDLTRYSLKDVPEYIKFVKENESKSKFTFYEELSIKELSESIRQEISNISKPFSEAVHINKMYHSSNKFVAFLSIFSGNSIGKIILSSTTGRLGKLYESEYRSNARFNLTKLLIALKSYHADNQALPDNLNELIPNYIKEIPIDPFDFNKLRYSKKDKVIYSLGPDLKEEKGLDEDNLFVELNFN